MGSATTNGISGDSSTGWNANLRYTFGFGLSIGGYYEWIKWKMNYANNPGGVAFSTALGDGNLQELKRNAWRLDAANPTWARTPSGCSTRRGATCAVRRRPTPSLGVASTAKTPGVTGWIVGYAYSLSKRSSVFAYGTVVDNDTNARVSGIVFGGIGPNSGGDPGYVGVGLRHLF